MLILYNIMSIISKHVYQILQKNLYSPPRSDFVEIICRMVYNFFMKFKGAIFDLDGTLLDTMDVWERVDEEYFESLSLPVPEGYALAIRDMTMLQAAEYTKSVTGAKEDAESICALWRKMVARHYAEEVRAKEGGLELLDALARSGVKAGIATTLTEETYLPALKRLGIESKFCAKASVRDVGRGKGFPDVYLHAAALMGLKPQECVVFEDILKGINSARSAGFCTVGVYDRSSAADEAAIRRASMLYVKDLSDPDIIKLFV